MNLDLLFAIIFYSLILVLFFKYRSRFEVQGKIVALFKTQLGIKWMESISKKDEQKWLVVLGYILLIAGLILGVFGFVANHQLWLIVGSFSLFFGLLLAIPLNLWGHIGTTIGFIGMAVILFLLVKGTITMLFVADAPPAVAPVLPGVSVPGLPNLSFWHWIVAIFLVATVHEFSHGIWARLYKIKIKSSGFLFFGPILGAFVEPEEKELNKKSKPKQLAVFAAGPFSNIIFGIFFLLIMNFITGPLYGNVYEGTGINIQTIIENQPAAQAGLVAPIIIYEINGQKTTDAVQFLNATASLKPNDKVKVVTDKGSYDLVAGKNPDNESRGFIGVADFTLKAAPKTAIIEKYGSFLPSAVEWINMLVFWLVVMNFGIGLFNLLPLGPIDGGRMFLTAMLGIFKNETKAKKIWGFMSFFCLMLIFINLAPYLWKLLLFILKPFTLLLTLL
ncbi:site-2 protease family protein [Candidatus Woesearchaeota archaeon]|nr:site-2 protease family protein [Candidatus Woesearchaeota archaeon]